MLYNLMSRHETMPVESHHRHRLHRLALATPVLFFFPLMPLGWNPIYPAVIAMAAGTGAAVWCRPDLLAKTFIGGILFLVFYAIFIVGLRITTPTYIEQVWNLPALSGILPAGIPVKELLFGGAFGLYWANVYEHLTWSKSSPLPKRDGV